MVKPAANHLAKLAEYLGKPDHRGVRSVQNFTERRPSSVRKCDEAVLFVQYFFTAGLCERVVSCPSTGGEAWREVQTEPQQPRIPNSLEPIIHRGKKIQFSSLLGDRAMPCVVLQPAGRERDRSHPFL